MLKRVDHVFAWVTWLAAGVVVAMLLFGPALVAHDSPASSPVVSYGGGSPTSAKQLFISNCGSCHTFAPAGTTGQIGPNLDQVSLTAAQAAAQIRNGGGTMPAFAGTLTLAQIEAVAKFVATQR